MNTLKKRIVVIVALVMMMIATVVPAAAYDNSTSRGDSVPVRCGTGC